MIWEIRTHDGPKSPYIPQLLHIMLGPDCYTCAPEILLSVVVDLTSANCHLW